jgi:DNA polymerase-3 subunit gamma/tau
VLSFSDGHLTADQVHAMLGTADDERLHALASAMSERDAATALTQLDAAIDAGVDAGRIAEQLLGFFRDLMAVTVGCDPSLQRHTAASMHDELKQLGQRWGLQTVLAVVSLIDQTLVRIRHSVYGRVLLESTVIQICNLPDLQAIADLAAAAGSGQPLPPAPQKKKLAAESQSSPVRVAPPQPPSRPKEIGAKQSPLAGETPPPAHASSSAPESSSAPASSSAPESPPASAPETFVRQSAAVTSPPAEAVAQQASAATATTPPVPAPGGGTATRRDTIELSQSTVQQVLQSALREVSQMTASFASLASVSLEGDAKITLTFPAEASMAMKRMDLPEHRGALIEAIASLVGRPVTVSLVAGPPSRSAGPVANAAPRQSAKERMERMRQIEGHPWIQACVETFGAEIVKVEPRN